MSECVTQAAAGLQVDAVGSDGDTEAMPRSEPTWEKLCSVALYVDEELRQRLLAVKEASGLTWADFLLGGFDEHYGELDELFPPLTSGKSPLPPRPRQRRRHPGKARMIQFSVRRQDLDVLDATVERLQVPSRNELLIAVIQLALAKRGQT